MKFNKRLELVLFTFLLVVGEIEVTDIPKSKKLVFSGAFRGARSKNNDDADSFEEDGLITSTGPFASLEVYGMNSEGILDSLSDISKYHKNVLRKPTEKSTQTLEFANIDVYGAENDLKVNKSNTASSLKEEATHPKHFEYEEKSSSAVLEELSPDKIGTSENGNTLPIFLTEPESVFVVKNRPAVLKCKAAHALQLHFKCSGSSQPPPSVHDKHVDPHTGVHLEEVTATIHRDLVDEYFGKGPFRCECHAWSSRGVVKSQSATVNIAFLRKQFVTSPTSLRIEVGSRAELYCKPPNGFPEPKISWYKNNALLTEKKEQGPFISPTGALVFIQASLQDMANYTCNAENIAGKRMSESAVLIVYVNGGWSPWSQWKDCKCSGKLSEGRKRVRSCTNPIPLNGGAQCSGPLIQKSLDCVSCPDETQIVQTDGFEINTNRRVGRWTSWSEWSACSAECIQIRRRKCVSNEEKPGNVINLPGSALSTGVIITSGNGANVVGYAKSQCSGKDIQTAECRGDFCPIDRDDFDWIFYLGIGAVSAIIFALGLAFIWWAKRANSRTPQYNIARTEYTHDIQKKDIRIHIGSINDSYDYANCHQRFISNNSNLGCTTSEHHYDVPNLSASYTNPIDEISVQYLTDTPDSSTVDTSNSINDVAQKLVSVSSSRGMNSESVGCSGGNLTLYNDQVMLYVPELAIGKNLKKYVTLTLLSDDCNRVRITDSLLICSSIVHCTPSNYNFLKPVIIKIPHCLTQPELWNVNIYHADNDLEDINMSWRKIIAVGEETINTPVFVQIESNHVYVMTEQLGRFVVVAQPKSNVNVSQPSVRMKLIAFSQLTPSSANCSLRIYVVKNFPNSRDICTEIENQLGGSYMGESMVFGFQLNNCDLNIRVRTTHLEAHDVEMYEHIIPYNHILSNNSILHCEFAIKLHQDVIENLKFEVDFMQSNERVSLDELYSFFLPERNNMLSDSIPDRHTIVSVDIQGKCTNDMNTGHIQLPRATKRLICASLDPPRSDERDWRLLAKKLNSDRYLAYFATKPSPTEQILNLWECRANSSSHTIMELLMALKDMNRQDVMDIITETIGPLWV